MAMEDPIQNTTLFPFEKSYRAVSRRADGLLHKMFGAGCGRREMWVLLCIAADGRSQKEIGECVGLHPNVVVKLLDGMEGTGLVRRARSASDRREQMVEASTEGKRITRKYMLEKDVLLRQVFYPLTDEQIATWRALAWLILGSGNGLTAEEESDG